MKIIKLVLFYSLFLTIFGCASIAGNNTRAVSVRSQPEGAAIYVDNERYGVTPSVVTLPTYIYGGKSITLKKPGYHDQTLRVNSAFQPIALLDILLPITFVVDAATGNIVKIDPSNLNLNTQLQRA